MDNENDVLCEKIINEICAVFLKDSELATFEIIPTLQNQNKSPVIHVEHNLGLESWCTKHVYDYAHKTTISYKLGHNKNIYNGNVIKYLNCALLLNPDVTTFWHIRRQLVERNRLRIHKEFQFSAIVLTKKPKSSEAFAYRRWLYSFQSGESIDWGGEISICERCADKSSNNYHAWSHRQWILQKAPIFLKSEILLTEKFIKKHITDYSCYHYRQFVLQLTYELSHYNREEKSYTYIKAMIEHYLDSKVNSTNDILISLLPGVDLDIYSDELIKSFLYCCNLAAYDIKLCGELTNMFGFRESFDYHRRASLKFIFDNCIKFYNIKSDHLNSVDKTFLIAIKKSEGMLDEKHEKWCSLFLRFNNSSEEAI